MRRLLDGRSESLVLSHLPVGDIALMFPSRLGRGHRDSVTNKTMGVICSPQERVCRGSVANKTQSATSRPGRGPPPGGDIVLMF